MPSGREDGPWVLESLAISLNKRSALKMQIAGFRKNKNLSHFAFCTDPEKGSGYFMEREDAEYYYVSLY